MSGWSARLRLRLAVIGGVLLLFGIRQVQSLQIRPKPCANAVGQKGTCMFVWECIKTDGKPLGTCVDGFLFGSCCAHNDAVNAVPDSSAAAVVGSTPAPTKPLGSPSFSVTSHPLTVTGLPHQKPVAKPPSVSIVVKPPIPAIITPLQKPPSTPSFWTTGFTVTSKPTLVQVSQWTSPVPTVTLATAASTTQFVSPTLTYTPSRPTFKPVVVTLRPPSSAASGPEAASSPPSTKKPPSGKKTECGVPPLHPQTKVVGGKNAAFGAWPWQVSVRRTSFFGFSSTHRCGGAILNSEWIATAGHCVDDLLLSQIRIRVGEYDFASVMEPYPHVERGAKQKVVHPQYNFFTYENDLALVRLEEPLEFMPHIAPICLPRDDVSLVGRNATVTGWGRLSEGGVLPSILQEVQVPIVSNDKCKNMFLAAGRHEYIPDIFMCAGYVEGGRDSCQGDSGGPLQVQGDDGRWFLAGIISWGIGCAEPNLPGVCTRISKFKDWILRNVT